MGSSGESDRTSPAGGGLGRHSRSHTVPRGPWELVDKSEIGPWLAYLWARLGEFLARNLPESVTPPILSTLRFLYSRFSKRRMLMMRRHLEKVLGPIGESEMEQRLARANLLYARYWYETFRLPAMSPEDVLYRLETRNEEVIAEAAKSGRGLVLALPHLGNWDFAGCYVSLKYKPVLAVAEYLKPPSAFAHWKKIRERLGMRIVALDGTTEPAKQAMRYLRSGGIVGLVADRWLGGASIPVDFFGEKTLVPAGPATLARRTDALLVPVGLYIRDDGTHLGIVDAPVVCPRTSDAKRDIAETTQRLVERFEQLIRLDPEQWHLYTPFWPSDWEALGLEAPFKVWD